MRSYFDLLQDKSNSPWFDDDEKDEFLMDVIYDYINEYIGDGNTPSTLESNKGSADAISTLIETASVTSTSAGLLDTTQLAAGFTGTPFHPLQISLNSVPAKFVRFNDLWKFQNNTYKEASDSQPLYTIDNSGWKVYAGNVNAKAFSVTAIVHPTAITDLPVHKHYEQVARAMAKTGLVTSDEALAMIGQKAEVK